MSLVDRRIVRRASIATGLYTVGAAAVLLHGPTPVELASERGRVARVSAPDSALLQRMLDAEDARAADSAGLQPIFEGLRSRDAAVRRIAVRAIGRLEQRTHAATVEPLLRDPAAAVRAEAVNALGQIAKAEGPNGPPGGDERERLWMRVPTVFAGLAKDESDPAVLGAMARVLGRLPYPTADAARNAVDAIAGLTKTPPTGTALAREPWFGVVHGIDALLRRFPALRTEPGVIRVASFPRARPATGAKRESGWSRETNVMLAAIRGRVLGVMPGSQGAVSDSALREVKARFLADFGDSDPEVRRQVAAFAALAPALDDASRERLVTAALRDRAPAVRVEGVRAYARRQRPACAALITASRDANAHVALTAIDALAAPCEPAAAAVSRLAELVRALPARPVTRAGARGTWHAGAHAAVALARVAPDTVRPMLPRLIAHPVWQVRMYAARAAGELADTTTLRALLGDRTDNVRDAAVTSLSALVRPASASSARARVERSAEHDSMFAAQLGRPDYQLVLDAARALEGARPSPSLIEALFAALERITEQGRETSRDPRIELLARIETMAGRDQIARITPYLTDYDPAIAERATQVLRTWGIASSMPAPRPLPRIPVSLADVARLRSARVRVTMAPESGGGSFELALFVDDAPATIARFADAVRRGYYNGLTFHRVATNFVIQGGSPGANEYEGAARFMRDELGLRSHERGTLGISTRGRDTGDAQIFVNLIDNWRLDHDYTVFAEVVRGMTTVDNVIEGDVIRRIEILGAR